MSADLDLMNVEVLERDNADPTGRMVLQEGISCHSLNNWKNGQKYAILCWKNGQNVYLCILKNGQRYA